MNEVQGERFVGTQELRRDLSRILGDLQEQGGEVVVTRQGKPVAVLVEAEKYAEILAALREFSDPLYLAEQLEARRDFEAGGGVSLRDVLAKKRP